MCWGDGSFGVLGNGGLTLDPLRFDIPGAVVEVRGGYTLRGGQLAFAGQLFMDAGVSQAVGGWKAWLLKPFDPIFRKNGRTFIPLTISGTRADPKFGVDMKRVFSKEPATLSPARRPSTAPIRPPRTTPPPAPAVARAR